MKYLYPDRDRNNDAKGFLIAAGAPVGGDRECGVATFD
jgi:hypothetical protein